MKSLISFMICTYNSPKLIRRCLDSVIKQKYSGKKEILIIDGGSNEETLRVIGEYCRKFNYIKVINNKKRLPEGYGYGKWLGWRKCKGEFVFIVDQDNELQGENCLNEMLKPFKKEDLFGVLCLTISKKEDSITNKYVALMGTDPFFAYRSLDGIKNIKKIGEDKGDYTLVRLDKENPLITGGNCFLYKKKYLDEQGGYVQDTENILKLVKAGYNKLAIPKKGLTHHFAVKGFFDFLRKKRRWANSYEKKDKEFSYIPKSKEAKRQFIFNLFFISTILPTTFIGLKQFVKTRKKEWLLHPILSICTESIYFLYTFLRIII